MHISLIGSGNVATHLALAFAQHGHTIDQIWSYHEDHAALLASRVGARPTTQIRDLRNDADFYIVAVTDSALYTTISSLRLQDALVLHTSGITPIEVLQNTSLRYGAVWSPHSFNRDIAIDYSTLSFCVECCDEETTRQAVNIFSDISPKVYPVTLRERQMLHLSAVFVDNFATALYAIAQQLCRESDIPFDLLCPLMQGAVNKAQWGDARHLMTGPAVRNDQCTIDLHRQLLNHHPHYLNLYNELTHLIQVICPQKTTPKHD